MSQVGRDRNSAKLLRKQQSHNHTTCSVPAEMPHKKCFVPAEIHHEYFPLGVLECYHQHQQKVLQDGCVHSECPTICGNNAEKVKSPYNAYYKRIKLEHLTFIIRYYVIYFIKKLWQRKKKEFFTKHVLHCITQG